jgi:hypothetical protein
MPRNTDRIRAAGWLTIPDIQSYVELLTGKHYSTDGVRDWATRGKRGVRLNVNRDFGRFLVSPEELLRFLRETRLIRDPVESAINDTELFSIPAPPAEETPQDTRMLDRLAVLKSRKERLAAAAVVPSPISGTTDCLAAEPQLIPLSSETPQA